MEIPLEYETPLVYELYFIVSTESSASMYLIPNFIELHFFQYNQLSCVGI